MYSNVSIFFTKHFFSGGDGQKLSDDFIFMDNQVFKPIFNVGMMPFISHSKPKTTRV